jgi:hypothetical protein
MIIALATKNVYQAEKVLLFCFKSPLYFAEKSFHFLIATIDFNITSTPRKKLSIVTPQLSSANNFRFTPTKNVYDTRRRKKHGL